MKKVWLLIIVSLCAQFAFAAFPKDSSVCSAQAFSLSQQRNTLLYLQNIKTKKFEQSIGKKLSLTEKLSFKFMQRQLKKQHDEKQETDTVAAIGGFLLGFFLGILGVGIAYLLPKNKTLRKSALIGFGVAVILSLFIILLIISGDIPIF